MTRDPGLSQTPTNSESKVGGAVVGERVVSIGAADVWGMSEPTTASEGSVDIGVDVEDLMGWNNGHLVDDVAFGGVDVEAPITAVPGQAADAVRALVDGEAVDHSGG